MTEKFENFFHFFLFIYFQTWSESPDREISPLFFNPSLTHHPLDRNVYQLVVSPVVLLGYSLVEAWALMELALRGSHICQHRPSNKAQLET